MKKLLFIVMLLGSMFMYSQELKVDSIFVLNPNTGKVIHTIKKEVDMDKVLDSLSKKEKSRIFHLYHYLNNGEVYKCRVRKKKVFNTII